MQVAGKAGLFSGWSSAANSTAVEWQHICFLMEQLVSKHRDVYDDKESTRKIEAIKSH